MSGTLAIDVGGTFTDVTFADAATGASWVAKTPSTPGDLSAGFIAAIRKVLALAQRGPADVIRVLHGTTTATNAILEGKTPPTALVTTAGFKYVLEIGRHDIPRHGNLYGWSKPARPVSPERVFEVTERLDHEGRVLTPLDEAEARAVARQLAQLGVPAVAVVFLHAYANMAHEQRMHAILREEYPGLLVSLSSEVLPQFREFERTMATALNAAVMPPVSRYMSVLRDALDAEGVRAPLLIMKSDGGVTSAATCVRQPVQTVLSGPAAGVVGALSVARAAGIDDIISIDVGGTSADICLVRGGRPEITKDGTIGPFPLKLPMIDIHTIGAGGGSIAVASGAGRLTVGPRSAGAAPGPVAYGRGGTEPTVTDAHLVLARIQPGAARRRGAARREGGARGHRGADRAAARARRRGRGGRDRRDHRQLDGARDPPRVGRPRARSATLHAGAVRRRRAAARVPARGAARHSGRRDPAAAGRALHVGAARHRHPRHVRPHGGHRRSATRSTIRPRCRRSRRRGRSWNRKRARGSTTSTCRASASASSGPPTCATSTRASS